MPIRSEPAKVLILSNDDNTWTPADYEEVDLELARMLNGLIENGYQVEVLTIRHSVVNELGRHPNYSPDEWLIFNWCEQYYDRPWTDTEITTELELLGYVFTGAGPRTMQTSMDKGLVRRLLCEAGVPLPEGRAYVNDHVEDWTIFPAIVKPTNQHSSYGISRASLVESLPELRRQVQWVLDEFRPAAALVEEFIDGREVHVPLVGNRSIEALPSVEVDYTLFNDRRDRIYTNEAKFDKLKVPYYLTKFLCPAPLDAETQIRLEEAARQAYRAAHCRDYGRVDLRLKDGQPIVLDVNPNSDLTFESDHAMAAKVLGLTYGQLAAQIVDCALERWPGSPA